MKDSATRTRRATATTLVAITVSVALHGCHGSSSDGLRLRTFTVDQDVPEQTIPGDAATAGNPLSTSVTVAMPDVTQEPEYQSEVFDVVRVVASADVTLSIAPTSPYPDFSFIDSISVWVGPPGGGGSSQQIALLSSGDPQFQPGNTTLQLETTDVDLSELVEMGNYELRVDVTGVVPSADVIFDGVVSFDIKVGLKL